MMTAKQVIKYLQEMGEEYPEALNQPLLAVIHRHGLNIYADGPVGVAWVQPGRLQISFPVENCKRAKFFSSDKAKVLT
jgi:hypothetical protein